MRDYECWKKGDVHWGWWWRETESGMDMRRRASRDEEVEEDWLRTMGDRGRWESGTSGRVTGRGGDRDETGSTARTKFVSRAGRDGRRCI